MSQVARTLTALIDRYVRYLDMLGRATVEADPDWPSPCEYGPPDAHGLVRWRPVPMETTPDFQDFEQKIGEALHPDLKAFYGSLWSAPVQAQSREEVVLLRTVWNPDDLARTQQAIADHVQGRREALRGGITVFVASTDSDLFFSVENGTGLVLLEESGHPPRGVVAPSLTEFLAGLRVGAE